ncbi:MAG: DUF167 domain-containing protein [Alphaproteobacteria bacterium]|nr:DUF167 domain-containing protein [Alphaproteobacteria bacterium]
MPENGPHAPSTRISGSPAGVLVPVRVTPKARVNAIDGAVTDADGTKRLKLSVTAAPADGRANGAVIALLAKAWKLPKSSLSIAAGGRSRAKTVLAVGEPKAILERIRQGIPAS